MMIEIKPTSTALKVDSSASEIWKALGSVVITDGLADGWIVLN